MAWDMLSPSPVRRGRHVFVLSVRYNNRFPAVNAMNLVLYRDSVDRRVEVIFPLILAHSPRLAINARSLRS